MFIIKKFTPQPAGKFSGAEKMSVRAKSTLPSSIEGDKLSEALNGHLDKLDNNFIDRSLEKLGSSVEEEDFDEISGRFVSNDEDDSFEVVFTDTPAVNRSYRLSECESEDSFVVFEESPDNCYTSQDVFGDDSDDVASDSSDSDSDDGVIDETASSNRIKDLTEDNLCSETPSVDEVDCAVRICEEIPSSDLVCDLGGELSTGVLLNFRKKQLRKHLPPKKVHFSEKPPKVHVMRVWAFAARLARPGHWERYAIDRERFKRRIAEVDKALSWVFAPQHRCNVISQRLLPWWNAQMGIEFTDKTRIEVHKTDEIELSREESL